MITLAVAHSPHVVFPFSGIALIMLGAGIAAFVTGAMMARTFDSSAWVRSAGMFLAICGGVFIVLAIGIQVGAWAGIG